MRPDNPFFDFERNFKTAPTHHLTINLKKARRHQIAFEKVDFNVAEKTLYSFRRCLEAKIFSKSYRRRFKNPLPIFGSVEKHDPDHRWHFHIVIKKPHFISDEDFENAIYETAKNNPYVAPQKTYTIKIISLADKTLNDINAVCNYNVKHLFKKMNDNAIYVM
jgi:hypothetical protein